MLFNSFQFLLVFLPASLASYYLVARCLPQWRLWFLLALSFAFYGYWDWRFAPLLAASILVNWIVARAFDRVVGRSGLITLSIVGNLAVLGFFKYYNFFVGLFPAFELPHVDVVLPLGISFFTFHHIMYLTDLRGGLAPKYDLVRYGLYIGFFPQILSGPLVRWREVMHQFEADPFAQPETAERCTRGLVLLILGLCEKTMLGDGLARIATPIFAANQTAAVSVSDAWLGTLAFTFQIYFDFAGYTDMALGTALLFGITLPQNFNAPYRARSLQDFWRRWHMTLSRFLRDYLYIPLGGSRHGLAMQLWALFATMALGGLWHGAGLNFIAWGILHGVGLGVGVLWRRARLTMPEVLSIPLTFLFVMLCWVLFHSGSFSAAWGLYLSLAGFADRGAAWSNSSVALLLTAAAISIGLPNAWEATQNLRSRRRLAVATGTLLALAVLRLNTGENFEFIYFRF